MLNYRIRLMQSICVFLKRIIIILIKPVKKQKKTIQEIACTECLPMQSNVPTLPLTQTSDEVITMDTTSTSAEAEVRSPSIFVYRVSKYAEFSKLLTVRVRKQTVS